MLENILGKQYKWWYVLSYFYRKNTAFRASTLSAMVGKLLTLGATILIWWLNIRAGSNLFDFKTLFTYYILGSMISLGNGVHWGVANHIMLGTLSSLLLAPTKVMTRIILGDFGWWFFPKVVELIILFVAMFVGWENVIQADFVHVLLFLLLGLIGHLISVFFAYIIGTIAFFVIEVNGIIDIHGQAMQFLSGKAIPLNTLSYFTPLIFLPFSFTFYHPMQIYLGKYSPLQTLYVFLGGIAWCLALYLFAQFLFKIGMKKNESVGL